MGVAIRPVLQLIRLPNVFTAAADGLAGWLMVGGALDDLRGWLPIAGASMSLYAAGMALNDWFDLEVDRAERPGRPLPSGAVPIGLAAAIGWGGLALGLALASLAGPALVVAGLLAAAIVGYNAGLKHTFLGPWAMGACRGLNMAMGIAAVDASRFDVPGFDADPRTAAICIAIVFGIFVAGVTWISRSEAFGGGKRNLIAGVVIQIVSLLVLCDVRPRPENVLSWREHPSVLAGLLLLWAIGSQILRVGSEAIDRPTPELVRRAVKTGVLSLVWIDVALVMSARGFAPALAVAAFWPPAFLLARRLYAT